jgi:hypothetical protein
VGNVFLPEKIDQAIKLGREFDIYKRMIDDLTMVPFTQFYIGVDAGLAQASSPMKIKSTGMATRMERRQMRLKIALFRIIYVRSAGAAGLTG